MPKVLHIGPCDSPGGMANVMHILAEHPPEGWEAELLASHVVGSPWAKWRAYRRARSTLIRMLNDPTQRPDVVHLHTAADWSWWRKAKFARIIQKSGAPSIAHIHSGQFDTWYESSNLGKQRSIRSVLEHPLTKGVVLNDAWKKHLEPQLGPLTTVSNPIQPGLEPPSTPRKKHNLLLLGRDTAVKGHDFSIALATHLRTDFPKLTLTLTGRSQSDAEWIQSLGWISEADKNSLLKEATILLVPSGFEGQPMVIHEALACGLPVCASDRILEVPEDVSVARYEDISHWAKQITEVLQSPPSTSKLLESSQPYRIENIRKEWSAVYESVIVL